MGALVHPDDPEVTLDVSLVPEDLELAAWPGEPDSRRAPDLPDHVDAEAHATHVEAFHAEAAALLARPSGSVPSQCVTLVKSFEGFSAHQYRDSVGVLTIGYGTTEADVKPLPSFLTEPQGAQLLGEMLARKYMPYIDALGVKLNDNQRSGFCSFIYNVGPGGVAASTHVGAALRAHDVTEAADDILAWNRAGGQVLAGLTRRREAEHALILSRPTPVSSLAGYPAKEAEWIHEYDHLLLTHGNGARVRELRGEMLTERRLVWHVAQPRPRGDGHGWDYRERRARYGSLLARTT